MTWKLLACVRWSADDERTWPVVLAKTTKFTKENPCAGGTFDGWVFLMDLRDASVLCAAGFEVRNSHGVWTNQSASREELERQLQADLKTNFQAATADRCGPPAR